MGRIRTIKPELFAHEQMNELEETFPLLRPMLTFAGLFTVSDKKGRFEWRPRKLKLAILPFVDSYPIEESLNLLEQNGYVQRYEVDGKPYGFIPTWDLHQRITGTEATAPARYPDPLGNTVESPSDSTGNINDTKKAETPKKKAGRKRAPKSEPYTSDFQLPPALEPWFEAIWYDLYPEKVICKGDLVEVQRGRRNKGRERFAEWCKKLKPVAIYLAFRAYIKNDERVKDGYVQALTTFLGPGKATVKDYLETVLPYLEKHPALGALTAPPESEEAFQALLAKDREAANG